MIQLYHAIIYQPILNLLVFLYNTAAFRDFGLAIILSTILIRLILFPVFQKSTRHQMVMQKLQPKIKEIQKEHKRDLEKQSQAMMALYKEHNVNPFMSLILVIIQIPIIIALYRIFLQPLTPEVFKDLYSFLQAPASFNQSFLGLINLRESSILMVGLAALAQYFQIKTTLPRGGKELSQQDKIAKQMAFIGPILTLVIFWKLPAAASLYWAVTSLFSIGQQAIIERQIKESEKQ